MTDLNRRHTVFGSLLLFAASVLIYSPVFKFEFSNYDDFRIIGEQPHLYADGSVADRIKQIVYLDLPREEPLIVRDLSWLLDSILFGYNRPFGYHYSNVIYHSLVMVFAFLLLLRLTNPATAVISSLLLLVSAAHVEPVAWIMGRKDNLAALFSLISIYLFLGFQAATHRRSRIVFYVASIAFMGAAMLSKINSVVSPAVLLLCALIGDGEFLRKDQSPLALVRAFRRVIIATLPFFLIAIAVFFWYRAQLSAFGLFDNALDYTSGELLRVLFILNPLIFLEYLGIILLPWNLEAYYTSPTLFAPFSNVQIAVALLVMASVLATLVALWRINRTACLLLLCFIVALLPYANWVYQGFWYANRYVYFGSVFLIGAFGSVVVGMQNSQAAGAIKVIGLGMAAWVFFHNAYYRYEYLPVWRNGESLWSHEIGLETASINDYNNLTGTLIGQAERSGGKNKEVWLEKARVANEGAFSLDLPEYELSWLSVAHYHRGLILAYSDADLESQLKEFVAAVDSSAGFTKALWSVGVVYYQMALDETDPDMRNQLASDSLRYVQRHFAGRGHDRKSLADEQAFYRKFQLDFPGVLANQGGAE